MQQSTEDNQIYTSHGTEALMKPTASVNSVLICYISDNRRDKACNQSGWVIVLSLQL